MRLVLAVIPILLLAGCPQDECGYVPPDQGMCLGCSDNRTCGAAAACLRFADGAYHCQQAIGVGPCGQPAPGCGAPACLDANRLSTGFELAGMCVEERLYCNHGCVPGGDSDGGAPDDGGSAGGSGSASSSDVAHCAP